MVTVVDEIKIAAPEDEAPKEEGQQSNFTAEKRTAMRSVPSNLHVETLPFMFEKMADDTLKFRKEEQPLEQAQGALPYLNKRVRTGLYSDDGSYGLSSIVLEDKSSLKLSPL